MGILIHSTYQEMVYSNKILFKTNNLQVNVKKITVSHKRKGTCLPDSFTGYSKMNEYERCQKFNFGQEQFVQALT